MAVLVQANLNFIPLYDILQWIDMNRISCVVVVSQANEEDMTFYMETGKIIFASSTKPGKKLGEFLVKAGVIKGPQAYLALKESKNNNIFFTRYLIENKLISLKELNEHFAKLVELILVDAISCADASVSVTTPLSDRMLDGPVHLETGRAIFDAVRILDEIKRDLQKRDEVINAIIKRIYNEEFQLPIMPDVVTQLNALIQNENSNFQDIAKVIMTDQVIASSILKIANSSFYGGTGQVDSLQLAIVRLGIREIRNIVTSIYIKSINFSDVPKENLQAILDNSLKTAFMASGLAHICKLDPEEAFMAGLLLDIGKTVILSVSTDFKIEQNQLEELLDSQHAEIGATIAKKWNYPESIQRLIRYHHNKSFAGISNSMIDMIQIADNAVSTNLEGELGQKEMQSLCLSHEAVLDVYNKTMDIYARIR